MTVLELKKIVDKAVADGWGDLHAGVMQKHPSQPGYVPLPFTAEVRDWSGWGNMSFCICIKDTTS